MGRKFALLLTLNYATIKIGDIDGSCCAANHIAVQQALSLLKSPLIYHITHLL